MSENGTVREMQGYSAASGSDAVCAIIQRAMIVFTPRVFQQFKVPPDCVLPKTGGKRPPGSLLLLSLLMRRRLAGMKMGTTAVLQM